MINRSKNILMFPHLIPGDMLGGKKHIYNNINGGFKMLADFNLIRNKFFGGNVIQFGKVKEYGGVYLCPHYETKRILGFYIDDPTTLTELGQSLIEQHYPNLTIVFEKFAPTPHRELTAEEIKKKQELIEKAKEYGSTPEKLSHSTIEELDGMLKAWESGKSGKTVIIESPSIDDEGDMPVTISHRSRSKR